jgi:3-oxoacyl-[acyl-carrier protein] reductase
MGKLEHKVAIVTGASKGIGASIARHLAAEGAAVVVNYAASREGADRVGADIARAGGRAVAPTSTGSSRRPRRPLDASTSWSTTRESTSSVPSRRSPRSTSTSTST